MRLRVHVLLVGEFVPLRFDEDIKVRDDLDELLELLGFVEFVDLFFLFENVLAHLVH